MWVLILLGSVIGLVSFMMIADQITWKDYPIADQYWISGLILIGFVASIMAMIIQWRRRESNPRPQQQLNRVIHKLRRFFLKPTKINGQPPTLTVIDVPPLKRVHSGLFIFNGTTHIAYLGQMVQGDHPIKQLKLLRSDYYCLQLFAILLAL